MATQTTDYTTADGTRSGLSRAVLWTGIALGTFLAVMAIRDGVRLRVGGMPSWLGVAVGALIVWALIAAASVASAELVRRHGKTAARHAGRQGKRGAVAGARATRHHGGRLLAYLEAKARTRWAARQQGRRDATGASAGQPTRRADGKPETDADKRFFDLRESGYTGPIDQDGNITDPAANGGTMTQPARGPSRITPARRARGAATRSGGAMPAVWNAVIARTADFEPESDGDLLAWMGDEVAGVAAYAEALVDLYESCTQGIGLDPVSMAALHDVADAQAHASETMSGARKKFADHYDRPREFAAEGGLMPHDGRWIQGEGDA